MIKTISEMDKDLFRKAEKKLLELHDTDSWYCRFTFGELKKAAAYLREFGLTFTTAEERDFLRRFNVFELNTIRRLVNTTTEEKIKAAEQVVKTATQKTDRYLMSLVEEIKIDHAIERFAEEKRRNSSRLNRRTGEKDVEYGRLQEIFK